MSKNSAVLLVVIALTAHCSVYVSGQPGAAGMSNTLAADGNAQNAANQVSSNIKHHGMWNVIFNGSHSNGNIGNSD